MEQISKENIEKFLNYYQDFHDSLITNINYSIEESIIELYIDVFGSNEPEDKEADMLDIKKTRLRIVFNGVERCNNKEMFTWDYINKAYMKYITLEGKEFICFASDEVDPMVYIVSDNVEYEKIKP